MDVSVIIPTRNEAGSIGECIEKAFRAFERMGVRGEVIVSDSSTDGTPEISASMGARVVTPDRLGYGYAYLYAFKHARGKYVVMSDGDGTYDLEEMPRLLEPLMRGEADVVLGTRLRGRILPGAMPRLHRYIGNPLLTFILGRFYKVEVSDAHTGFRALTREALEKLDLRSDGMEFASEFLIKAAYAGLRIAEVPITYYPREGGESKLRSFRDGWRHLKLIMLLAPKYMYYVPGLAALLAGAVLMLAALLRANLGYSPGIHSSILGAMMAILGYNILVAGVLADLLLSRTIGRFTSRVTKLLARHLTVERAALLGAAMAASALAYLAYIACIWVASGYHYIPLRGENVVALALLTLGVQTFFHSMTLQLARG